MRGARGTGRGQIVLPRSDGALARYEANMIRFSLQKKIALVQCVRRLEIESPGDQTGG